MGQPNGFVVSVFGQRLLGVLAAEATVADPAESGTDGNPDIVVDEHRSGPDLPAHPHYPVAVLGENRCDETELGAVGDPHGLVLAGERDQCDDRTENLLGGHPHIGNDVGEQGRRHVEAVRQSRIAGQWRLSGDASALGHADVEVIRDPFLLRGGYQRSDVCGWVGAVAHPQPAHRGGQPAFELGKDLVLHQDPRRRRAGFALVEEAPVDGGQ